MDPNALIDSITEDLNTLALRGFLREAQDMANRLPDHDHKTYGQIEMARRRIDGETAEVSEHWASTSEWPATDLDGDAGSRLLDMQEWLDRGGFAPDTARLETMDAAYRRAHPHLSPGIRSRCVDILRRTGTADYTA